MEQPLIVTPEKSCVREVKSVNGGSMDDNYDRDRNQEDHITVKCPAKNCPYQGSIGQVIGHIGGEKDRSHSNFDVIECPVDGCSYSGPIDSVSGHINAKQTDEHALETLLETPVFQIVK